MFSKEWFEDLTKININTVKSHSTDLDKRENIYLDGKWKIRCYDNPNSVPQNIYNGEIPDSLKEVTVPGHLQLQGFDLPQYTNTQYPWEGKEQLNPPQIPQIDNLTAVYYKEFYIDKKENTHITFDGFESSLALFINGIFIGYREGGFTKTEFDISNNIKKGLNYLTCIVVKFCKGSWLSDQDFWIFSGIFRSVYLTHPNDNRIDDCFIRPTLNESFDKGNINIELSLTGKKTDQIRVELSNPKNLSDKISNEDLIYLKKDSYKIIYQDKFSKLINLTVKNPKLWNHENPILYSLRVSILDNNENILDSKEYEFGFRNIKINKNVILLNGKRIIFHGTNKHEFSKEKGRAIGYDVIVKDLLTLKQNNFNSIRCSHYPNQEIFYTLCDRMGFLVIDEVNLETHGTYLDEYHEETIDPDQYIPSSKKEWEEAVLDRTKSMAMQNKNHPSILFWSCGNESKDGEVILNASKYLKSLNDNRLIHYENVRVNSKFSDTSDVESQMYTKPEDVEIFLNKHKEKPFILCEYLHAMGNSCGNLKLYTELEDKFEYYQGGFIWDFKDQTIEYNNKVYAGTHFMQPNDEDFCSNGITFSNSDNSAKLKEIKKLYSPIQITTDKDRILIKNNSLFTNTDCYSFKIEISKNGELLEKREFKLNLNPGDSKFINHNTEMGNKDIIINTFCLDKQNHVINYDSFSQFSPGDTNPIFNSNQKTLLPIVKGNDYCGCKVKDYQFMIQKAFYGSITGIFKKQENLLKLPINLEFWRAPINNEIANLSRQRWMRYKIASLYKHVISFYQDESSFSSIFDCAGMKVSMKHRFFKEGFCQIEIELLERLNEFSKDMPCFGISFGLDKKYDRISYYGNTTGESYIDRREGKLISKAQENCIDQYLPYIRPQECGNKTDLRYIQITDKNNKGLKITASTIFEGSILPYSAHELENAIHEEDLPNHNYNVVRIMHGSCGVGGDDTWGAPVHPQYLYYPPKTKWIIEIEIL